jgi:hypothetical protein
VIEETQEHESINDFCQRFTGNNSETANRNRKRPKNNAAKRAKRDSDDMLMTEEDSDFL